MILTIQACYGAQMSRYFFHIRRGQILIRDEEGMECRTMTAVLDEARASARDIASEARWSLDALASIEIEDEDGNEVRPTSSTRWVH